jgi:hypothetical protein
VTTLSFQFLFSIQHDVDLGRPRLRSVNGRDTTTFAIWNDVVQGRVKHVSPNWNRSVEGAVLRLDVHDNGAGFDPGARSEGHGPVS